MLKCWIPDPDDRPSFEELRRILESKLLNLNYASDSVDTIIYENID
jgi:hypothetical protein